MPNDAVVEAALLPCPFCGGKANLTRKGTYRQSMIVTCRDCGACVESGDVVGMTDPKNYHWNRRRVASDLAQVKAALEIIAGQRQCIDNLMSNADVAIEALAILERAGVR